LSAVNYLTIDNNLFSEFSSSSLPALRQRYWIVSVEKFKTKPWC